MHTVDPFATLLDLEVMVLGSIPQGSAVLWLDTGLEPYDCQTLLEAQAACQRYGCDDAERALNLWAMEQAERH